MRWINNNDGVSTITRQRCDRWTSREPWATIASRPMNSSIVGMYKMRAPVERVCRLIAQYEQCLLFTRLLIDWIHVHTPFEKSLRNCVAMTEGLRVDSHLACFGQQDFGCNSLWIFELLWYPYKYTWVQATNVLFHVCVCWMPKTWSVGNLSWWVVVVAWSLVSFIHPSQICRFTCLHFALIYVDLRFLFKGCDGFGRSFLLTG